MIGELEGLVGPGAELRLGQRFEAGGGGAKGLGQHGREAAEARLGVVEEGLAQRHLSSAVMFALRRASKSPYRYSSGAPNGRRAAGRRDG